jgi:hypothetical protein
VGKPSHSASPSLSVSISSRYFCPGQDRYTRLRHTRATSPAGKWQFRSTCLVLSHRIRLFANGHVAVTTWSSHVVTESPVWFSRRVHACRVQGVLKPRQRFSLNIVRASGFISHCRQRTHIRAPGSQHCHSTRESGSLHCCIYACESRWSQLPQHRQRALLQPACCPRRPR